MPKPKLTKPVRDAGKTLRDPKSTKKDKELSAKVLRDRVGKNGKR